MCSAACFYNGSLNKLLSDLGIRSSGNGQEIRCALGDFRHRETPVKESLICFAKFYELDCEILEAEQFSQ